MVSRVGCCGDGRLYIWWDGRLVFDMTLVYPLTFVFFCKAERGGTEGGERERERDGGRETEGERVRERERGGGEERERREKRERGVNRQTGAQTHRQQHKEIDR